MITAFQGEDTQQLQSQKEEGKGMTLEGFRWISGQNTEKGEELQRRMGAIS